MPLRVIYNVKGHSMECPYDNIFVKTVCNYFNASAYLLLTSSQFTTFQNAST